MIVKCDKKKEEFANGKVLYRIDFSYLSTWSGEYVYLSIETYDFEKYKFYEVSNTYKLRLEEMGQDK